MAKERFEILKHIVRFISSVMMLAAMTSIIWAVGPWVETHYMPVVQKFEVEDMKTSRVGDTAVEFIATFVKIRNCEFIGIGWYKKSTNERVPVVTLREVGNADTTPNRPPGFTRTGPWILYLTADEMKNDSYAQLFHRCHPFWVTTTEFYP